MLSICSDRTNRRKNSRNPIEANNTTKMLRITNITEKTKVTITEETKRISKEKLRMINPAVLLFQIEIKKKKIKREGGRHTNIRVRIHRLLVDLPNLTNN